MSVSNNNTPTSRHSIREDFERCRSPRPSSPFVQLTLEKRRKEKHHQQQQLEMQQHLQNDAKWKQQQQHIQSLLDKENDDFMLDIVNGSCQRIFDHNHNSISRETLTTETKRRMCQDELLPGCQMTFEDHLDLFTHCRQPLSFLSFFHENVTNDGMGVELLPAGAYMMPRFCEYCGSDDTRYCLATCQRPKLYFQKKRSPFEKRNPIKWDPITDEYIPPPPQAPPPELPGHHQQRHSFMPESYTRPLSPSILPKTSTNWVANFFHPSSPSSGGGVGV